MPEDWDSKRAASDNRAFCRRVVRHLVTEAGVRQFLDIGSGLPAQGNVHEVAQEIEPSARVVYVDHDPMVITHAQALLGDTGTTRAIMADLRRPDQILGNTVVRGFIDFAEPVGLLMFAVVHHINDDEDPAGLVAYLSNALAPGSHLAISHFHNPGSARPEDSRRAARSESMFAQTFGTGRWRTREEILAYFGDMELLDPGLVPLPEWRPDPGDDLEPHHLYHLFAGGVARVAARHTDRRSRSISPGQRDKV
jgi:SAM-dependent methyltransferase